MQKKKNKVWLYYVLFGVCCICFLLYKALGDFPKVFSFSYVDKAFDEVKEKYKRAFDKHFEANAPRFN